MILFSVNIEFDQNQIIGKLTFPEDRFQEIREVVDMKLEAQTFSLCVQSSRLQQC